MGGSTRDTGKKFRDLVEDTSGKNIIDDLDLPTFDLPGVSDSLKEKNLRLRKKFEDIGVVDPFPDVLDPLDPGEDDDDVVPPPPDVPTHGEDGDEAEARRQAIRSARLVKAAFRGRGRAATVATSAGGIKNGKKTKRKRLTGE